MHSGAAKMCAVLHCIWLANGSGACKNRLVLKPYLAVLSYRGAKAFSAAGVLARLPMSMVVLSIVLLVEHYYDGFGPAGRVAATYTIFQAICSPQIAKLVDVYGQRKIMQPALIIAIISLSAFVFVTTNRAPAIWLYITAAFTGAFIGSMGAMVRARWTNIVDDPRHLHTAFSLESTLDELVFVVGPVMATTLAAAFSPVLGMVVAIVATGVGGFSFLAQRATEPTPAGRVRGQRLTSVLRLPPVVVVALIFGGMGIIFGATDVATVAYTKELGNPAMAGPILAAMAAGSLVAAFIYGARNFVMPAWKRLVIGCVLLSASVSLLFFVYSLPLLALVMFGAGFTIAPTLITGNQVVHETVPSNRLTEGLTWVGTAMGVGFSIGSSVTGQVVDNLGAHPAYGVVVGAGILSAIVGLGCASLLRRTANTPPAQGPILIERGVKLGPDYDPILGHEPAPESESDPEPASEPDPPDRSPS